TARRSAPPALPAGRLRILEELEVVSLVRGAHWVASLTAPGRTVRRGSQSPQGMGEAAPALTGIELVLDRYRPLRPLGGPGPRSAAGAGPRCGSPAPSGRGSTSRSRSSPGRAGRLHGPSARPPPLRNCAIPPACVRGDSAATRVTSTSRTSSFLDAHIAR